MTSELDVEFETAPRRGARLGGWAFGFALAVPLWLLTESILLVYALSSTSPAIIDGLAGGMYFAGFVVIPVLLLVASVLGVGALALNRLAGKVLGGVALLIALFSIVAFILVMAFSFVGGSGPA